MIGRVSVILFILIAGLGLSDGTAQAAMVVLLGTGTPNADPERSGPSVAIVVGNRSYLVDAGPGLVRRAATAAQKYGIEALTAPNLDMVFLTHLHSDHTVGLPDLLLTPWVLERRAPLRVFGPPGTEAMMDHLSAAYQLDIRNRTDGREPANRTGFVAHTTEIDSGLVYQDSLVRVRAYRVPHGDWADGMALAYRFETADRVIVVSGDTGPSDVIIRACAGCDVLVHEVYSAGRLALRAPEWQRYHQRAHTSAPELADVASRARPNLLVLYHQLYWGASDEELLAELTAAYSGRVVSGRDLDLFPE